MHAIVAPGELLIGRQLGLHLLKALLGYQRGYVTN
jgi:hypothetical protein